MNIGGNSGPSARTGDPSRLLARAFPIFHPELQDKRGEKLMQTGSFSRMDVFAILNDVTGPANLEPSDDQTVRLCCNPLKQTGIAC